MKQNIMKVLLVLVPLLANAETMRTGSLRWVERNTGEVLMGTYFTPMGFGPAELAPHLAAIAAAMALMLAAFSLLLKRPGLGKACKSVCFLGALFAVLPLFSKGEQMLMPSVAVPIYLLGEFALMGAHLKAEKKEEIPENALVKTE